MVLFFKSQTYHDFTEIETKGNKTMYVYIIIRIYIYYIKQTYVFILTTES